MIKKINIIVEGGSSELPMGAAGLLAGRKGLKVILTSTVPGAKLLFIGGCVCCGDRLRGRGIAGAIIVDLGHVDRLPCRGAAVAALPALA